MNLNGYNDVTVITANVDGPAKFVITEVNYTFKPVYPWSHKITAAVDRWSLFKLAVPKLGYANPKGYARFESV